MGVICFPEESMAAWELPRKSETIRQGSVINSWGNFNREKDPYEFFAKRQSTGPAIFLRTQTSGAPDDSDSKDVTYV
tara:strand:+ start:100 stop:330 length:231 start_codon:yes stop_codon:yes gene_type:complete